MGCRKAPIIPVPFLNVSLSFTLIVLAQEDRSMVAVKSMNNRVSIYQYPN